jgi:hypothetical protein
MNRNRFYVEISDHDFVTGNELAGIERVTLGVLCSRILGDYFKSREKLVREYAEIRGTLIGGSPANILAAVPDDVRDYFNRIEPTLRFDGDGYFLTNDEIREMFPECGLIRISKYLRSIDYYQKIVKLHGRTCRGYWVRKLKSDPKVDLTDIEPTSFI